MFRLIFTAFGIFASTLVIIAIDRKIRSSGSYDLSISDPGWGEMILLTLLCNIAALPYYFGKSRRSTGWGFIGFLMTGGCIIAGFVGGVAGSVFDVVVHTR